ncbi:nuclear speckle splicing regulatory protein 1 isoform X1 [Phasianus colchicus]|uniref:nuclear speckle splicing regulatory protein 1 isoform X1 n=2 Tax=Phasianus colchicus TaxID=9054 RepID=UPI00129D4932|nr:nuclear speckle splicing regulatory protein 1 isoform X1 [Phasianus colchicus]
MAALSKQYGLIMPKKLQQKNLASNKLSVFADDSDDEPSVGESLQKEALKKQAMKQTKLEIQKALSEDATVYEYDSIYDEMQQKKKESSARLLSGRDEKKPRYIHNILKAAEIRKKEQEKRMERKIQKEREMEGGEFADKEAFVTSAYKKKLQERAEEEERERREAALEAYLDVTKQKDLSGFYRHLLNQRVGEEEVPKCSFREARIKEDKSDSCYDESSQRNKGPYERQRLKPSAKEEDNPDADTDLESDSNDEKGHKSVKVSLKKKKKRASSESSEEETKHHKSQRHSRSPSSSSAEEELRTKDQTNHLTKKGEGRKGYDEQYREKDYQRSRTHEKDHQREKEERHRYGDHTGKDYYRRREEQDDKQREKERKEREGHGREWRKAKEREEKCSEKEREKERIRSGKDKSSDREKERGEKCREKEDHSKERREKGSSDEKYRDRRESSPAALEKDDTDLEKERRRREREVDEKKSSSSGNLSGQKRKDGEGEKEEKEQTQKPPESMSKFAKRSNEETVMSARDRYLARQMARVGAKSYIEKEED